jgi:hypothetical protein
MKRTNLLLVGVMILNLVGIGMAQAHDSQKLGNVVLEKRTFDLNDFDCLSNFKKERDGSYCIVKIPGMKETAFDVRAKNGSVDRSFVDVRRSIDQVRYGVQFTPTGYTMTFERGDAGSLVRGMGAAEAKKYVEKLIQHYDGKAEIYVYTLE